MITPSTFVLHFDTGVVIGDSCPFLESNYHMHYHNAASPISDATTGRRKCRVWRTSGSWNCTCNWDDCSSYYTIFVILGGAFIHFFHVAFCSEIILNCSWYNTIITSCMVANKSKQ